MNDYSAGSGGGAILAFFFGLIIIAAIYVWVSASLAAVFKKVGEPTWAAWVPYYNQAVVLKLGGFSPFLMFIVLVPYLGWLAVAVLLVISAYRINVAFGFREGSVVGMTILAVFFPIWSSVLGWGSARWIGPDPRLRLGFAGVPGAGDPVTGFPPAFYQHFSPQYPQQYAQPYGGYPRQPGQPAQPAQPGYGAGYASAPGAFAPPAPPAGYAAPAAPAGYVPPAAPAGYVPPAAPADYVPPAAPQGYVPPPAPPMPTAPASPFAPDDELDGIDDPADTAPGAQSPTEPAAEADAAAPQDAQPTDAQPTDAQPTDAAPVDTQPVAPATAAPPVIDSVPGGPEGAAHTSRDSQTHPETPEPVEDAAPAAPADPWAPPAIVTTPRRSPMPEDSADFSDTSAEVSAVAGAPRAGTPMSARSSVSALQHDAEQADDDALDETVVAPRRRTEWMLTPPLGAQVRLTSPVLILGRRPAADPAYPQAQLIDLADKTRTVSKTHARLELVGDSWTITDLGSTNGVAVVDGEGVETELAAGGSHGVGETFLLGDATVRLTRTQD